MTSDTIQSAFLRTAERCRDKTAFNYFDPVRKQDQIEAVLHTGQAKSKLSNGVDKEWKEVTYGRFGSDSKAIASYLINSGINKGDRIAMVAENRPEWCIAYMGIMFAGAIAVPIDAQLNPEAVRNFLTDSETKIIFCSSKTALTIKEALEGLEIKKIDFDSSDFKEILNLKQTAEFPDTDPDDIASIIYTSGTTGIPKGVMLTHRNFISDAEAAIRADVISETDSVLSILPLHHTYPFMCTFLVPVFLGAVTTFSPSLKGPDIIAAIRDKGVTILIGVPQLLELIRNGIMNKLSILPFPVSWLMKNLAKLCGMIRRTTGINFGKLVFVPAHKALGKQFRFFGSGGAKLDPDVIKDLEAIGFTVLEGYGLTETSPIVTFNPIKKRKIGSVGKPFPSVEIRIADPAGSGMWGIGKEGEVAIKGPMVMKGYYKNPEATAKTIKDGWFYVGDLGYIDEDGYLFITGRIKEVIVLGSGKNIYPEEIEKEYSTIPLIKEICVFGLEEKGRIESLRAIIVPDIENAKKQRISNIQEALSWDINRVSNRLPSYMRIKGFDLYPDPLPRTPLGKLRRFMIKDLLKVKGEKLKVKKEDERLMSDETGRRVVGCIKPLLREELQILSIDNLELDLGLDSLQRIELVVCIEKEFSAKLPDTFASDVQTVGDLVAKIKTISEHPTLATLPETTGGFPLILSQEPSDEEKKAVGLKQGAIEWIFVAFLAGILKFLFRIFFRLEVKGIENIPESPFILAPNHCSNMDGFVVAAGAPIKTFRSLYFQGFQKYFSNVLTSFFARLAHVIPIDPETYLSKALQLSGYVLRNNKSLCIFPEGGRTIDGNLMEFKKGIGIIALELNVPVVPASIQGSFEALPRGAYWPKFGKIRLTFGKPFYPSDLPTTEKLPDMDKYQYFADKLRERVKELTST